jgi:hypothetical protein
MSDEAAEWCMVCANKFPRQPKITKPEDWWEPQPEKDKEAIQRTVEKVKAASPEETASRGLPLDLEDKDYLVFRYSPGSVRGEATLKTVKERTGGNDPLFQYYEDLNPDEEVLKVWPVEGKPLKGLSHIIDMTPSYIRNEHGNDMGRIDQALDQEGLRAADILTPHVNVHKGVWTTTQPKEQVGKIVYGTVNVSMISFIHPVEREYNWDDIATMSQNDLEIAIAVVFRPSPATQGKSAILQKMASKFKMPVKNIRLSP